LGLRKLKELPSQPNLREMLKTSLIILVTAETACIITAVTADLIFYKQAIYLSIPLALLAGAFTVVAPQAYKKMKQAKDTLT
jgi:positive regulator of sigma E activity